jgi:hypothetical protein
MFEHSRFSSLRRVGPVLIALKIALAVLVLFNAYVSVRVLTHDGLTTPQKAFQVAIVWLLPIIGVSLVQLIVFARPSRPKDPAFDPIDQDSTPIGS